MVKKFHQISTGEISVYCIPISCPVNLTNVALSAIIMIGMCFVTHWYCIHFPNFQLSRIILVFSCLIRNSFLK
jgi:hypothetical protein